MVSLCPNFVVWLGPYGSPLQDSRHRLHIWWVLGTQQSVNLTVVQLAVIRLINVALTSVSDEDQGTLLSYTCICVYTGISGIP